MGRRCPREYRTRAEKFRGRHIFSPAEPLARGPARRRNSDLTWRHGASRALKCGPSSMNRVARAAAIAPSLRSHIEARRSQGALFSLREAVGIIVPLAVELAEYHRAGHTFFV